MGLAVFIQQRCGCPFSSISQFTCYPSHNRQDKYLTGQAGVDGCTAGEAEGQQVHPPAGGGGGGGERLQGMDDVNYSVTG
jgi:hypothetical protein